MLFLAQIKQYNYIHRIAVNVYGQEVSFKPNEESEPNP